MIQRVNEQNGRICIYRVSDSGPKRLLFVPWQYGISPIAPSGPRCEHPSANTSYGFYGHTNEVKGQLLCYLDSYELLVLIGFRFIWSVGTLPLTFPFVWQAARPSCCYTQASWSVATGHIKNQGCRTRQAGKKIKEKVLPWRCKRLKSLVSSSDCHSKHRSGASQIYWWKWNTLSSRPVCSKQILSTPDPF